MASTAGSAVLELLEHGSDTKHPCAVSSAELCDILTRHKDELPELRGQFGASALHVAAQHSRVQVLEHLLSLMPEHINCTDKCVV